MKVDFKVVEEFEYEIAKFFGSPAAVAIDSATHGLELCLRLKGAKYIVSPKHTYVSVPMLANKLGIELVWSNEVWDEMYQIYPNIYDSAVLWRKKSFIPKSFMCLSFQYQKHLSLGRGGMILCPDKEIYKELKKMAYDGREPGIPWREQGDISTMGYHYYMTPETAALGLEKLPAAIATEPRKWTVEDWPDISKMEVFQ